MKKGNKTIKQDASYEIIKHNFTYQRNKKESIQTMVITPTPARKEAAEGENQEG
ncbi:MAG: hypothetical protein ABFS09_02430 [Thermodesulfobacteriota bacterium]